VDNSACLPFTKKDRSISSGIPTTLNNSLTVAPHSTSILSLSPSFSLVRIVAFSGPLNLFRHGAMNGW
jgi:hypothetical protein